MDERQRDILTAVGVGFMLCVFWMWLALVLRSGNGS